VSVYDIALVVLLVITLALAGLAASAETALTSISRLKLRRLCEEGNHRALLITKLHRQPNEYLTAILTANTTAIIISATAADLIAAHHGLDSFWAQLIVGLLDALVVLILAEVTAKSLALSNMGYALAVAPTVNAMTVAFKPLVRAMSAFAGILSPGPAKGPFVTEEELKLLVTVGEEEGIIEEEEREMIHGIIEIGDMSVREVMIPRIDINAVEVHRPIREITDLILKFGRTRIPVYEETVDHVIGIAHAKDLLRYLQEHRDGDVRSVLRPAYFVSENLKLSDLLREMREKRQHMAIVVDEFGQTAGIVTIEDVIEEIVGPIRDEYDQLEEEEVQFLSPNEAVMDARVSLADVDDLLGVELEAEDVDSVGGFIQSQLGAIPTPGESIQVDGITLTVVSVKGQGIDKIRARSDKAFPGSVLRDDDAPSTGTERGG